MMASGGKTMTAGCRPPGTMTTSSACQGRRKARPPLSAAGKKTAAYSRSPVHSPAAESADAVSFAQIKKSLSGFCRTEIFSAARESSPPSAVTGPPRSQLKKIREAPGTPDTGSGSRAPSGSGRCLPFTAHDGEWADERAGLRHPFRQQLPAPKRAAFPASVTRLQSAGVRRWR